MRCIYFICPDNNSPIGGIKQIYRHAQVLQDAGFCTRVLHQTGGFSCDWFEHHVSIAYRAKATPRPFSRDLLKRYHVPDAVSQWLGSSPHNVFHVGETLRLREGGTKQLHQDDVLVLPEYLGAELHDYASEFPVVVLNQNGFYTFHGWGMERVNRSTVYSRANTRGIVCVSKHSESLLAKTFSQLPVHRVINGVNSAIFAPPPEGTVRRGIAYMPRKLPEHLESVLQRLHSRGKLAAWELMPIDGCSEAEVVKRLQSARVFLSTCNDEGFGLPPLEAGLCGALTVGYTGAAAAEYMLPEFCWPVPQRDIAAFGDAVEEVLARSEANDPALNERSRAFREFLVENYSVERERQSIIAAYSALCPRHVPSV